MIENNKRLSSDSYQIYSNVNCSSYGVRNAEKSLYCSYQYEWSYQTNCSVQAYHEEAVKTDIDEQGEYQVYEDVYYEEAYWQEQTEKNNSADAEGAVEKSMKKRLNTEKNAVDIDHIIKNKKHLLCHICHSEFLLNNHLHKHIQKDCTKAKLMKTTSVLMKITSMMKARSIYIKFTVIEAIHNDYEFWEWWYITVKAQLTHNREISSVYLNTECTMILINQQFLKNKMLNIAILQMLSLITVQELSSNTHESSEFTVIDLYLSDKNRKIAVIFCEIHLVENLKAHMLIRIDILTSEKISLNLTERKVTIESCDNIEIFLTITMRSINQIN